MVIFRASQLLNAERPLSRLDQYTIQHQIKSKYIQGKSPPHPIDVSTPTPYNQQM